MKPSLPTDPDRVRLLNLLDTAAAEQRNLLATVERLFHEATAAEVAVAAASDPVIAERIEAFVARFSRFQDMLGDKLLPLVLRMSGEEPQPVIGNLDRAERYGWLASADGWLRVRKLRNRMVHEYVTMAADLAAALDDIHGAVPSLSDFLAKLRAFAQLPTALTPSVGGARVATAPGQARVAVSTLRPSAVGARATILKPCSASQPPISAAE